MSKRGFHPNDPFGPLDRVVTFLLSILSVVLVLAFVLPLFPGGWSTTYYGSDEACATVNSFQIGNSESGSDQPLIESSRTHPETVEVCNTDAGPALHALALAGTLSGTVLLLVMLIALKLLERTARRVGMFTPATARKTAHLGWVLIVGCLVAELVRQLAAHQIVNSVIRDPSFRDGIGSILGRFDLPTTELIVGVGLLALGRILGRAVVLQENEDATI